MSYLHTEAELSTLEDARDDSKFGKVGVAAGDAVLFPNFFDVGQVVQYLSSSDVTTLSKTLQMQFPLEPLTGTTDTAKQ